jgi:hypothetical protein
MRSSAPSKSSNQGILACLTRYMHHVADHLPSGAMRNDYTPPRACSTKSKPHIEVRLHPRCLCLTGAPQLTQARHRTVGRSIYTLLRRSQQTHRRTHPEWRRYPRTNRRSLRAIAAYRLQGRRCRSKDDALPHRPTQGHDWQRYSCHGRRSKDSWSPRLAWRNSYC